MKRRLWKYCLKDKGPGQPSIRTSKWTKLGLGEQLTNAAGISLCRVLVAVLPARVSDSACSAAVSVPFGAIHQSSHLFYTAAISHKGTSWDWCKNSWNSLNLGESKLGLPAYSDSVGTAKKCHCKRNVTVTGIFSIGRFFFGSKKCHCKQNVTVTGVTVSGEACTFKL